MKIHDIMSRKVATVQSDATVRDLWKILFARRVNAIPVTDKKGILKGIVTKEDLLKILYPDYQEYFADIGSIEDFEKMEQKVHELGSTKASDVMCKRVVYTRSDTPIMRALSRMIVRRIDQLPVLDHEDTVIGMVTKGDIFYALIKGEVGKKSLTAKTLEKKSGSEKPVNRRIQKKSGKTR